MKTEFRLTASNISFVRIIRYSSSLVSMARFTALIVTDKYRIVIIGRFINHFSPHKLKKYILVNATSQQQIRKNSAHSVIPRWQFKKFMLFFYGW